MNTLGAVSGDHWLFSSCVIVSKETRGAVRLAQPRSLALCYCPTRCAADVAGLLLAPSLHPARISLVARREEPDCSTIYRAEVCVRDIIITGV